MDNDNYNDNYYDDSPKPHGIVYKIITRAILIFVLLFAVFLAMRIHINNHAPAVTEKTLWDGEAYSDYTENTDDFKLFSYDLESYYKEDGERVTRNVMTREKNIKFTAIEYMPSCEKLQFTIRYNEATAMEYDSGSTGEKFIFILRDDKGNEYNTYSYKSFEQDFLGKRRYNYRRLVYDGINLDDIETLTLYIYDINSVVTEKTYIESIILYDSYLPLTEKEITPPQSADGLTPSPYVRGLS